MSSNTRNPITETQKMTTKPKKVVIKKKAILATPEIEFKTTKEKGDAYEIFIKRLLLDSGDYEWVYLWNETPMRYLIESKIFTDYETIIKDDREIIKYGSFQLDEYNRHTELNKLQDLGIDLVAFNKLGKYVIIQCKFYKDTVDKNSMAGFHTYFLDCLKTNPEIQGKAYITNNLAPNLAKITRRNSIDYIIKPYECVNGAQLETMTTDYDDEAIILSPRDYQLEAINNLKEKHRAVLSMACGLGKTLVAILLAKLHNLVIVFSPLKAYVEQNEKKFKSQLGDEYATLIIDSDYARDINEIISFIKKNKKSCLFVTFKSCDKVLEIVKKYPKAYIIVDEFHNLSRYDALPYSNKDKYPQTDFNKLIYNEKYKILFMSATPRILGNGEDQAESVLDINNDYQGLEIDNDIFGKIEYSYSLGNAIKNNFITDYVVIVPSIAINQETEIDEINNFMTNKNINKNLLIKARFIIKGMLETGSRKCIIYLKSQEEALKFSNILKELAFKYFGRYICSNTIISDDSISSRRSKLKQFEETNELLCFLCNVQIMNEAIDIPACDSVFFANTTDNKIRTIQRLSRATRLNKDNPNKKAHIFVWCDNYRANLPNFICNIKEYDESFKFEDKLKRFDSVSWNNVTINDTTEKKELTDLQHLIVGIKGFSTYHERRAMIYDYVKETGKRPQRESKNEKEKELGSYFSDYEKIYVVKAGIMKNKEIYDDWTDLKKSFGLTLLSNKELWHTKYKRLLAFIKEFKRMPRQTKFDKYECSLASWVVENETEYKIKDRALSDINIWNIWDKFRQDYDSLINSDYYAFVDEIKTYSNFCDGNQRCPLYDTEEEYELNSWFIKRDRQHDNHKNNLKFERETRTWNEFKEKYKTLFEQRITALGEIENIRKLKKLNLLNKTIKFKATPIDTVDKIKARILDIDKFYDKFKFIPEEKKPKLENMTDQDYENMKIFGKWIDGARISYKGNNNKGSGIMKNQEARTLYENFINKYNIRTELQEWVDMYEKIICDTNNGILYVAIDKSYQWLKNNKKKYDANDNTGIIHKYPGLRNKFRLLLENYPQLFIDHNKIKEDTWVNNLLELRKHMESSDNVEKKNTITVCICRK
jgi:superfamily II DNA or RNA helicase